MPSYTHVKFECENKKCKNEFEVLHEMGAEPPACPKCGKASIEILMVNDFSGGHSVAFKGLSTPGSSMPIKSTMPKALREKWHSRRIEQFKKTGK